MNQTIHPAGDSEEALSPVNRAVLDSFLRAFGHQPQDFVVTVDAGKPVRFLGPDDRLITVERVSNAAQRRYIAASYSRWLADVLGDVDAGCFGCRPVPLHQGAQAQAVHH